MRLQPHEFMNHAPDEAGTKVRVNHNSPNCRGNSTSMVIERKNDGTISAKCFRCGRYGRDKDGNKPSMFNAPKNIDRSTNLPNDLEYEWCEWGVHATTYVNKFGFSEADTTLAGIGWSPRLRRLIIPVSNRTAENAGWIAKSFDQQPRYYTRTNTPENMYWQRENTDNGEPNSVLVVEDVLSALRGSEGISSFALLGTSLTNRMVRELSRYDKFYIWLDNDNSIVRQKQLEIFNKLSLYGDVKMIKSNTEVKELSIDKVKDILYNK